MTVDDDSDNSDESVLDELSSPEKVFAIATSSGEEATAISHLAANLNETVAELRTAASDQPVSSLTAALVSDPKEKAQEDSIDAPSVKKILKFAIPAIGVWLCSPLLSLIDTSAVGLLSGTAQQAALNPAVAVTEYTALLIVSCICLLTCI